MIILISTVTCPGCGQKIFLTEKPVMLSVAISKCRSVQDCIGLFFEDELVSDYKCDGCNKRVQIIKSAELASAPDVLIIQLKRYT